MNWIDSFRRVTRDGRWFPEIDGLRFVAIAAVFLFHLSIELTMRSGREIPVDATWAWLGRLVGNGDRGVDLFFVISGMILALPFARQRLAGGRPVSLKHFYLRRLTRIEPPFLVSLLLALAMLQVWQRSMIPDAGRIAATFLYQHGLRYGELSGLNAVTWSLEVEVQFYLIAPLLMQVFRLQSKGLRRGLLIAAIAAIGIAQAVLLQPEPEATRVKLSLLFSLQYFLAGLLLADLFVTHRRSEQGMYLWDCLAPLALWSIFWPPHGGLWTHALLPGAMAVVCLAASRGAWTRRALSTPVVAVLGGMCYSIYLMHLLVMAAVFKVSRHAIQPGWGYGPNLLIQIWTTGIPVVLACAVFYRTVERPCMEPTWSAQALAKIQRRTLVPSPFGQ